MAVNWFGMGEATSSITQAKIIGCYAVKFQIFNLNNIKDSSYLKELKRCILTKEQVELLYNYGKKEGIIVFFTPMYEEAIDWLFELGVPYIKIREKDNKRKDFYMKLKDFSGTIFVSCINPRDSIYYNLSLTNDNIKFLFCIPNYPANVQDYNYYFTKVFSGISDHTPGIQLIKEYWDKVEYLEKHIILRDGEIEDEWAIHFDQLDEVMKKCKQLKN